MNTARCYNQNMPCPLKRRKLYVPIYPLTRSDLDAQVHCAYFVVLKKPAVTKDYHDSFGRTARKLKLRGWSARVDSEKFHGYVEGCRRGLDKLKQLCELNKQTVVLRCEWHDEHEIRGFTAVNAFYTLSAIDNLPSFCKFPPLKCNAPSRPCAYK